MEEYFRKLVEDDPSLINCFKEAITNYGIQPFDATIMSKLRRVYYSSISGILYLLGETNESSTHGNKLELLAHVLEDEDYTIVHGKIRSDKDTTTSWIEVRSNHKTWIYDVESMLKFEKKYFDQLEHPEDSMRISKESIVSHIAHSDNTFKFEYIPMIIVWYISRYESNKDNPHYDDLQAEIKRYKKEINYSKAVDEYYEEMNSFTAISSL